MKKIYIIIGFVVLLLIIGYFTNWFGMKKANASTSERKRATILNALGCPSIPAGCVLSTNTSGASSTVTQGNVTYTCRCPDGSTTAPTL